VIYFKANGDRDRGRPRRNMEEKAKAEDCLLSRMRHIFRLLSLVARPLTCFFHVLRHLVAGGCDKVRAPSKLICPMSILIRCVGSAFATSVAACHASVAWEGARGKFDLFGRFGAKV